MSLDYLYEHMLEWNLRNLKHFHPKLALAPTALAKYKSDSEYVGLMESLNLLKCYASVSQTSEEFRVQNKAARFRGFPFRVQAAQKREDNELFTEICTSATQQEIDDKELFKSTLVVFAVPGSGEAKCLGKIHDIAGTGITETLTFGT